MRIGVCTSIDKIALMEKLGFDYVELNLNGLSSLSDEDFEKALEDVNKCSIKVEGCCVIIPKTLSLIGPSYDEKALESALNKGFGRMQRLGGSYAVFGSGKSRYVPEGMDYQDAYKELITVTDKIGNLAGKYGLKLVIEALNKDETNLINSISEALKLMKDVNNDNVKVLADGFHMAKENEDYQILYQCGDDLLHSHIASREGRAFPVLPTAENVSFIKTLKAVGYDGRLSIEAKTDKLEEDSLASIALIKKLWEEN
ncbi:MAG: sugar phosphate isomerase/epimerase [Sphaerochaetaceae bacterium]|nr:sugar phosphate isomerase/epimerase [Sphaerochaetaceae bacterium]